MPVLNGESLLKGPRGVDLARDFQGKGCFSIFKGLVWLVRMYIIETGM